MSAKVWLVVAALYLLPTLALAQVPTGTISGRVTDQSAGGTPGVTVTASSPNLQGVRTVVTSAFGDYAIPLLPPGQYSVVFELSGFQKVTRSVTVASTQSVPIDVKLALAEVTQTVDVVATADPLVDTAQIAMSIKQELMSALPSNRSMVASILMAPNVKATGPGGTSGGDGPLVISGSMSFDSLYLINGVQITENLRGQPFSLFIEDAIQETTVASGGISAEYGRFGGGLVNAITKSGGNNFSGTYRLSFNNDNWRATTPFNEPKLDDTIPTNEYTFGGPISRDHLWFFTAGRFRKSQEARQLAVTNIPYARTDDEQRYEFKATYSPMSGQTVRGAFTKISQKVTNLNFQNAMDMRSLYNQEQPQDLLSLNYNGVLSSSMTLEGQYSRRNFSFLFTGDGATDLANGTLLIDRARGGTGFRYWSPTFCVCTDDNRDNREMLVKASYFLSTSRYGAHNLVFGYDYNDDRRLSNNHQSGSDYRILGTSTVIVGESIYPVFLGNNSTIIEWDPIAQPSQGSNLRTHALFVNDAWRLNQGVSLNLGLRWDRNQGDDAAGNPVSSSGKLSPRLAVAWDPLEDGRWSVTGSFAQYVSGLNIAIAETSAAGKEGLYQWPYQGPSINAVASAPLVSPDAAILQVFDWFNANGGTSRTTTAATIPGVNSFVGGSLDSMYALEYAAGVSRTIGQRGTVRADYMFRDFNDFYVSRTDLNTGQVTTSLGSTFDIGLIENSNEALERRYQAGTFQATYRMEHGVSVGGTYTLSRTWGNFDGENAGSGPLPSYLYSYPEYREARWNLPDGNLGSDQRHRARIWGTYHAPLPESAGNMDIGILYSAASGIPYSAGGATAAAPGTGIGQIDPRPYVTNPGYAAPVGSVEYFFFPRDQYRTEAQHRTDFSLNYSYPIGRGADVFFHGELLNVFNQAQLCGCGASVFNNGGGSDIRTISAAVQTASTAGSGLQAFNPFTTTPVQDVNWRLGPTFGQAANRFAYTSPRTFRFSVGVRF